MKVFIRPTGAPLGAGVTLGFGPNGSAASLDTAPVNSGFAEGDLLLVQSDGGLVKVPATVLPGPITRANVVAALGYLPAASGGPSSVSQFNNTFQINAIWASMMH